MIDWNTILREHDININVDKFYTKLNKIINKYTPKLKIDGSKFPIWYSNGLIRLMGEKGSNNTKFKLLFKRKRSEANTKQKMDVIGFKQKIGCFIPSNPKRSLVRQNSNVMLTILLELKMHLPNIFLVLIRMHVVHAMYLWQPSLE